MPVSASPKAINDAFMLGPGLAAVLCLRVGMAVGGRIPAAARDGRTITDFDCGGGGRLQHIARRCRLAGGIRQCGHIPNCGSLVFRGYSWHAPVWQLPRPGTRQGKHNFGAVTSHGWGYVAVRWGCRWGEFLFPSHLLAFWGWRGCILRQAQDDSAGLGWLGKLRMIRRDWDGSAGSG